MLSLIIICSSGANRAAATETPQFQMSSEVTWKEFLDGLDQWFLCKSGRGLFDPYPYERPNVGDYLISRHYNTLSIIYSYILGYSLN